MREAVPNVPFQVCVYACVCIHRAHTHPSRHAHAHARTPDHISTYGRVQTLARCECTPLPLRALTCHMLRARSVQYMPMHPLPPLALSDAAARRQRRRLHQLPGQRRAQVLRGGGAPRHGRLPHLRQPQLRRQPQARHRRRRLGGRRRRGGHLVHGRHLQPEQGQVHHRLLPRPRAAARRVRHPRARHQGHGGAAQARRRADAHRRAAARVPLAAHPRAHARHRRHRCRLDARGACGGGGRRRRRGRLDGRRDAAAGDGHHLLLTHHAPLTCLPRTTHHAPLTHSSLLPTHQA